MSDRDSIIDDETAEAIAWLLQITAGHYGAAPAKPAKRSRHRTLSAQKQPTPAETESEQKAAVDGTECT